MGAIFGHLGFCIPQLQLYGCTCTNCIKERTVLQLFEIRFEEDGSFSAEISFKASFQECPNVNTYSFEFQVPTHVYTHLHLSSSYEGACLPTT